MAYHAHHWPYYHFLNGKLWDEQGRVAFKGRTFKDDHEAEQWLVDENIRGSITPYLPGHRRTGAEP